MQVVKHNPQVSISVVMATYNGEKYIEEQLRSLSEQKQLPDEVIIIDDCSTDHTIEKIKEWKESCGLNVIVEQHNKNCGVNITFQEAVQLAKSDIIMVCDQDDYWHKDKILETSKYFENGVGLVVCDANIVNENLQRAGMTMYKYIKFPVKFKKNVGYVKLSPDKASQLLLKRNYVTGMCMAVRRELLNDIFPIPQSMVYDTWIAWNVAQSEDLIFINKTLVEYRQHGNNAVGTEKKREDLRTYYSHRHEDKQLLLEKYKQLLCSKYLSYRAENYLNEAIDFYTWRYNFPGNALLKSVNICKYYFEGKYRKYTPNMNVEAIKDFLEIVYEKNDE